MFDNRETEADWITLNNLIPDNQKSVYPLQATVDKQADNVILREKSKHKPQHLDFRFIL